MSPRVKITDPVLYHKHGPEVVLKFNIDRFLNYSQAIDKIEAAGCPKPIVDRERAEIFKNALRNNHPLRYCHSKFSLYKADGEDGSGWVMDHAIPICIWPQNLAELRQSCETDKQFLNWTKTLVFLGWCGPIVKVPKSVDALVNKQYRYTNVVPERPFHRLRKGRADIRISLHEHFKVETDLIDASLADHYQLLENRFNFMKPIFEEVREWGALEQAIEFMSVHRPKPNPSMEQVMDDSA